MTAVVCDVAVVGAGPAGVGAALTASESGADVVLVDDARRPGGQVWRRPAPELDHPSPSSGRPERPAAPASPPSPSSAPPERPAAPASSPRHDHATAGIPPALRALEQSPIRILPETLAWGADGTTLLLAKSPTGDDPVELRARAIVLATGAYDRPLAFPGWTLPGVLTPGGAQATLKASRVAPGRRALVAGAGPFLLVVARALAEAGVEVIEVAEATALPRWLAHGRRALRHPAKLAELAGHRAALRAAGVPVRHGRMVVRAEGDGRVERAIVARVDGDWRPVPGSEEAIDVDLLCVGSGFLPNLDLAAALGCEIRWRPRLAAHVVAVGPDQRTSIPGVFAAGEITGIGGADLAVAEGEIAGAHAARHTGRRNAPSPGTSQLRARSRQRHLASLLADLFAIQPGAWELADADTLICRCEEVPLSTVRHAAATASPNALKVTTRVGMGRCQGRICGPLLAHALGRPDSSFTLRPPVRPIQLATLAAAAAEKR